MTETAAHLVDHVIPRVPVRHQWVLSFPIPLRVLLAAHPQLLSSVLQITHRAISILRSVDGTSLYHFSTFLIKQAGLKRAQATTGAVTLIQHFRSAANLNIHLHCLVLDGVYHTTKGATVFQPVRAPSAEQLHMLLHQIIKRVMK